MVNVGTAGGLHPGMAGTHEVSTVFQHDYDDLALHAVTGRHDGPPLALSATRAVVPASSNPPSAPGGPAAPVLATGDVVVAGGSVRGRLARGAVRVDGEAQAIAAGAAVVGGAPRVGAHVVDSAEAGA